MNSRASHRVRMRDRSGVILVCVLVCVVVVSGMIASGLRSTLLTLRTVKNERKEMQVMFLAEAGAKRAAHQLEQDPSYEGESWKPRVSGGEETANVQIHVKRPSPEDIHIVSVQVRLIDAGSDTNGVQRTYQFPIPTTNR